MTEALANLRMDDRNQEDKYLQLVQENQQLKLAQHADKQKINKLAAKLIKSMAGKSEQIISVEDGNERIVQLEKENRGLKTKLQSARHQLEAYTRLPLAPGYKGHLASSMKNVWVAGPKPKFHHQSPTSSTPIENIPNATIPILSPAIHSHSHATSTAILWESNAENYQREILTLKDKISSQEAKINEVKLRLTEYQSNEQRTEIQDNIEVIKVQKQIKDKSNEAAQMQAKYTKAEQDLRIVKNSHDNLLVQYDQLNNNVREQRSHITQLQSQIRTFESSKDTGHLYTTHHISAIERENSILKEANEKLIANAFDSDRESQWIETERIMRSKITELENFIKADLNARNENLHRLATEIGRREQCESEKHHLEAEKLKLKAHVENLERRVQAMTQEDINWEDVHQAIDHIKQSDNTKYKQTKVYEENMESLKVSYAETVQELEKTRNLLIAQNKINREYQAETELINRQAEFHKKEYERQIEEYSKGLDERAKRINRLEKYIQDMAYGRKSILKEEGEQIGVDGIDSGQNLMEVQISKIELKSDALRLMQSVNSSILLTIDMFDFETQVTPVIIGPSASVNFTFQYYIVVSDLFVYYLSKESVTIELHQVVGSAYKTWAAGTIPLKELVSDTPGRLFFGVDLNGVTPQCMGVTIASVEVNIALKMSIAKSLTMYKERVAAMSLLNDHGENIAEATNVLIVTVHRLNALKCKYDNDSGPSAYIMYRVMDFADHDSAIAQPNINPELNDTYAWTLPIGHELHNYLRTQNLNVMVFDDSAQSEDQSYIGYASIPLLPLAHNKPITGSFPLIQEQKEAKPAIIDISLHWKFTYVTVAEPLYMTHPVVEIGAEPQLNIESRNENEQLKPTIIKTAMHKPRKTVTQNNEVHEQTNKNSPPAYFPAPIVLDRHAKAMQQPEEILQNAEAEESIASIASPVQQLQSGEETPERGDLIDPPSPQIFPQVSQRFSPPKSDTSSATSTPIPRVRRGSFTINKDPTSPPKSEILVETPKAPPRRLSGVKPASSQDYSASDEDLVMIEGKTEGENSRREEEQLLPLVVIGVHSLRLSQRSHLIRETPEEKPVKVFVEWKTDKDRAFLGLPPELCETPESFALPTNPQGTTYFNHLSKLPMDKEKMGVLKEMVKEGESLYFMVVSDPSDDQEVDCDELGTGQILLSTISTAGDLIEEDLNVVDTAGRRVAILNVTVQAKQAIDHDLQNY